MTKKRAGLWLRLCLGVASAATALGFSSAGWAQQQPFAPVVPIRVPPGTRGMQPNLALSYSVEGGNGALGVGWSLTGFSAITRVNYGYGINFDPTSPDTYAHSEAGLLVAQQDGTFHSSKETFMRFQPYGTNTTCGVGPCYWIVTDRSGMKYFYGDTSDSRLMVQDSKGAKTWALSRVQDLFGNYWSINYNNDPTNGVMTPHIITYTQGDPSVTTFHTVEFVYDPTPRSDTEETYYSNYGYLQKQLQRLSAIQIKSGGALLRQYLLSFEYGPSSSRSRLTSVQEQDATGNLLPAQTFSYEQGSPGFNLTAWGNTAGANNSSVVLSGDFDGDGRADTAFVYRSPANTVGFNVQLASGPNAGAFVWTPSNSGPWHQTPAWGTFLTGDFDGDGRTDIAFVHSIDDFAGCWGNTDPAYQNCDQGQIDVYHSTGGSFVRWGTVNAPFIGGSDWPIYGAWMTGDFNADGRTDIAFVGGKHVDATGPYYYAVVNWFYGNNSSTTPLNAYPGQQISNFLPIQNCSTVTSYCGGPRQLPCCEYWNPLWQYHMTILTGSFNGDGRTSIMLISNSGSTIQFSEVGPAYQRDPWVSDVKWKCGGDWQKCGTFVSMDFNGDGKTDIAYLSQAVPGSYDAASVRLATDIFYSRNLTPSMGGPVALDHKPTLISNFETWHGGTDWQNQGTFLKGDFNGDGKADLAYAWKNNYQIQIDIAAASAQGLIDSWTVWQQPSLPWLTDSSGQTWQTVQAFIPGDFDGDGKVDVNYARTNSTQWTYSNLSNFAAHPLPPDTLVATSNGLGGSQTVEYVSAPQFAGAITPSAVTAPYIANPAPQLLVKKIHTSDGQGHTYTTVYSYSNAKLLPGTIPTQRYLGFQQITATDEVTGQYVQTTYHQEPGLEGQPLTVKYFTSAGQMMRQMSYGYQLVVCPLTSCPPGASCVCISGWPSTGTEFVETTQTHDTTYEAGTGLYTRNTYYNYDNWGRVASVSNLADGLTPFYTNTTFYPEDRTQWILDRPQQTTVYTSSATLEDRHYTWLNDVPQEVDYLLDTTGTRVTTTFSYDTYGHLLSTTEPPTDDQLTRTTKIASYDPTFHAYPAVMVDARGVPTQRTYTPEGAVKTVTDENGAITTFDYDGFGRKTRITPPSDANQSYGTTQFTYNLTNNAYTQYIQSAKQVGPNNTIVEQTYFDGTGFTYRSQKTADSGSVCVFKQKDTAGRLGAVSNPTFNCNHGGDYWTIFSYEASGRPSRITTPDNRFTSYTYDADSHFSCPFGRLEHVFDPNNRETTRCINSRESPASVIDPLNQTTTYGYDALNRLTSVSLPGGGSSSIYFDTLGRKTKIVDSQVGVTTYAYQDNGNLKLTKSGDSAFTTWKSVSYSYDQLNRVIQKIVTDSASGAEGPIKYAYDESLYAYGKGRLTTVTGNNGLVTQYGYTPMGQLSVVHRQVKNPYTSITDNFTEQYKYDLGGRLSTLQYPDGSLAGYHYTTGGNLGSVDLGGVTQASWTNYDAFGAPANVSYLNGVASTYTYDTLMHQLNRLQTVKSAFLTQTIIQDLTLNWYSTQTPTNGVVLGSIQDNRGANTVINGVDTSETQTYWYDPLYRLASASGVWGSRSYGYDNGGAGIGNPTSFGGVTQRTITFAGTQLASASDTNGWSVGNIAYDSSGNITSKDVTQNGSTMTWTYTWTGENRLAGVTHGVRGGFLYGQSSMFYDESGQRFMKHTQSYFTFPAAPAITTTYAGKLYEKRNYSDSTPDRHTLHLFGNGELLMSWTRSGKIQTAFNEQNGWRTDIAAASLYNGHTVRGAAHKLYHWTRALVRHPRAKPLANLVLGSLLVALILSSLLRRRSRYSRSFRFAASSVLLTFGLSACTDSPRLGESSRDVLSSDGRGPALGTYFYHRNHINSSSVITDNAGNVISRMVYLPFGEVSQNNSTGSDVVTDKYTGQESDPDTGLYYYNARYYDPTLGRFLSADPIVANLFDSQAHNRYTYTRSNPITSTDSSGLCPNNNPLCDFLGTGGNGAGIGNIIAAGASALFGLFRWLGGSGGGSSSASHSRPLTPAPAGIPRNPLPVDRSSSSDANGTPKTLTMEELDALAAAHPWEFRLRGAWGTLAGIGSSLIHPDEVVKGVEMQLDEASFYMHEWIDAYHEGGFREAFGYQSRVLATWMLQDAMKGPAQRYMEQGGAAVQIGLVLVPMFGEFGAALDETALLTEHLEGAVARLESEGLTAGQARALAKNPGLEAAFRGERIDTFIKESVSKDPRLGGISITPRFTFGPDFYDLSTGRWWDVTTSGQWDLHLTKYQGFGTGIPLLY